MKSFPPRVELSILDIAWSWFLNVNQFFNLFKCKFDSLYQQLLCFVVAPPSNSPCFMFNCPNCPNLNKPGEWPWRALLVLKFTKRFKHSLLNLSLILYTVNYDLGDWKTLLLSLEQLLQIIGLFIFVLLLYIRWRLLVNMIKKLIRENLLSSPVNQCRVSARGGWGG